MTTNMDSNYTETWTATVQTADDTVTQQNLALLITFGMMTLTGTLLVLMNAFLLRDRSSFCKRFGTVEKHVAALVDEVRSLDRTRNCMLDIHKSQEDSLSSSNLLWMKLRLVEMQQSFDSVARNNYADRVTTVLMGASGETPHDRLRNACLGKYKLPQGDPEVLREMLGVPVPAGYVLDDRKMDQFIGTYLPGVRKDGNERFRHLLKTKVT